MSDYQGLAFTLTDLRGWCTAAGITDLDTAMHAWLTDNTTQPGRHVQQVLDAYRPGAQPGDQFSA